ncbi:MAG: B12-binding domain-containing radical SAM protein [Desulfovibrionaceae bacterium]|nr:B12-binding domain-containing radical SAM protein [Desulfovibrionaceae bacterium]
MEQQQPIRFYSQAAGVRAGQPAPGRKRRLLLIYPPMAGPTSPPLGAPMLKAYIERELPQWQVKVLDLNMWCFGRVFDMLRSGLLRPPPQALGGATPQELLKIPDFFRGKSADDFFHDPAAYSRYGKLLADLTNVINEHLSRAANAHKPGAPLDPLLAEALQLMVSEPADFYGVSMIFSQQLPVGALFGRLLRQQTGKKMFFGGSCFTAGAEDFLRWYPESTDVIIDGDGEEPLKQLLMQEGSPEGVSGAVFWRDGQIVRNAPEYRRDIDAYGGAPDFSDLDLAGYYSPQPIVPLLLSRGCYWRRCTFCVHYMSAGLTYRLHGLERVIDILRGMVAQGVRHFSFVDEMIAPGHFDNLADAIIAAGLDIAYYALAKPNKGFKPEILRKMARSGCKYLLWGVESGAQRVLDLMDKGTKVEDVERVLRDAHAAGIANHVYIMAGFPTETRAEFIDTLRFLDRNREVIYSIPRGLFSLTPGSPIFKNPERFGVTRVWQVRRTPLGGRWMHECDSGMARQEATDLLASAQPYLRAFHPYTVMIEYFRDHAMLLYAQRGMAAMRALPRHFPALAVLGEPPSNAASACFSSDHS